MRETRDVLKLTLSSFTFALAAAARTNFPVRWSTCRSQHIGNNCLKTLFSPFLLCLFYFIIIIGIIIAIVIVITFYLSPLLLLLFNLFKTSLPGSNLDKYLSYFDFKITLLLTSVTVTPQMDNNPLSVMKLLETSNSCRNRKRSSCEHCQ